MIMTTIRGRTPRRAARRMAGCYACALALVAPVVDNARAQAPDAPAADAAADASMLDIMTMMGMAPDLDPTVKVPVAATHARFRELLAARQGWRGATVDAVAADDAWMEDLAAVDTLRAVHLGRGRDVYEGNRFVTAKGLAALVRRPDLRRLSTMEWANPVTDELLEALAKGCPGMELLNFASPGPGPSTVTAKGVRAAAAWKGMLWLTLPLTPAVGDDDAAALVAAMPGLRGLWLGGSPRLGPKTLAALGACPQLRFLLVELGPRATDADVAALLAKLPRLALLGLHGTAPLTDATLAAIGESPAAAQGRLAEVEIADTGGITPAAVEALKKLRPELNLTLVDAEETPDADAPAPAAAEAPPNANPSNIRRWAGLAALRGPQGLTVPYGTNDETFRELLAKRDDWRFLALETNEVADDWLAPLPALPDLVYFHTGALVGKRLTPNALATVARCAKLRSLRLAIGQGLDDAGVKALAAGCPDLVDLHLIQEEHRTPSGVTDAGVAALARLPALRGLILDVNPSVGDDAMAALGRHAAKLDCLFLFKARRVTDAGLAALGGCRELRELRLGLAPTATGAGVAALVEGAPRLRVLDLGGGEALGDAALLAAANAADLREIVLDGGARNLTDAGLAALARVPALQRVTLWQAERISDAGLEALAASRSLKELSLPAAAGITDRGLAAFARHSTLEKLDLTAAKGITDAGLDALAENTTLNWLDLPEGGGVTKDRADRFRKTQKTHHGMRLNMR